MGQIDELCLGNTLEETKESSLAGSVFELGQSHASVLSFWQHRGGTSRGGIGCSAPM